MSPPDQKLLVSLPMEVAADLVRNGLAVPLPRTRNPLLDPDVWISGIQTATTLVTLAQAPGTVRSLWHALRAWHDRRASGSERCKIEVRTKAGSARLEVSSDLSVEDLAALLRLLRPTDPPE